MKPIFPVLAIAMAASLSFADVSVTLDDLSDRRALKDMFKGLEVTLNLSGPELAEAKGVKIEVAEAKDDLGTDVSKVERFGFGGEFEQLQKKFGSEAKPGEFELKLKLPNPARAAKKLMISGTVKLLVPSKDPAGVVTVNPAKESGKAVESDALKAAGVEITFTAPKGAEAGYKIVDPKNAVASVEYCSADGKPLETSGTSSFGFNGTKNITVSLNNPVPADSVAKIYLITAKSVVTLPFKLDGLDLP